MFFPDLLPKLIYRLGEIFLPLSLTFLGLCYMAANINGFLKWLFLCFKAKKSSMRWSIAGNWAHRESPSVEMSMVGIGEEQHFQECPCVLLKGGQCLLSTSLALLIPCSSTCSSCLWDEGLVPGSRGGGQAQCRWRRCTSVLLPPMFLQLCFG